MWTWQFRKWSKWTRRSSTMSLGGVNKPSVISVEFNCAASRPRQRSTTIVAGQRLTPLLRPSFTFKTSLCVSLGSSKNTISSPLFSLLSISLSLKLSELLSLELRVLRETSWSVAYSRSLSVLQKTNIIILERKWKKYLNTFSV